MTRKRTLDQIPPFKVILENLVFPHYVTYMPSNIYKTNNMKSPTSATYILPINVYMKIIQNIYDNYFKVALQAVACWPTVRLPLKVLSAESQNIFKDKRQSHMARAVAPWRYAALMLLAEEEVYRYLVYTIYQGLLTKISLFSVNN